MIATPTRTQTQGRLVRPTSNLIITEEIFQNNLVRPASKLHPYFTLHLRRLTGDEFVDYKYEEHSEADVVYKLHCDGWWFTK